MGRQRQFTEHGTGHCLCVLPIGAAAPIAVDEGPLPAKAADRRADDQAAGIGSGRHSLSFFERQHSEAESFSLADSVIRLTGGHGDAVSA